MFKKEANSKICGIAPIQQKLQLVDVYL